ncbi:DJ-1/PfpI family protein [Engelhardtia mirabilis]|uniref:Chaperone protein YajL n=1 Tax=Engelhardtia mirabilis TaxID=2528011 RepID=A0A518BRX5_9BACT|nr:Chaperone protein YajL [Planctomycetes bacterium Pla133]QDV04051.1 Chaperone protein YajL [Planctomycetes bacterium Pla86]
MTEPDRQHILVPLADGFEETEAVAVIDVLRRAGLRVTVAGLAPGPITGSHQIAMVPDAALADVDLATVTSIVLPGGMPGTTNLMADRRIVDLVRRLYAAGETVAAICAAPRVLAEAGIVSGLELTSHPSVRGMLAGATVLDMPRVVTAQGIGQGTGPVVTSQGPGTALEFGLELVRRWVGPEKATELQAAMLIALPES